MASPLVNQKGPRVAYDKIADSLYGEFQRASGLQLQDISPIETSDRLIKALRARAKKYHTNMAGERLKEDWLGDVSVADAYVYFVK
jgi:hypothetical protein